MVCWHLTENNLSKSNVRKSVTFSISIFKKNFDGKWAFLANNTSFRLETFFGQNIPPRHNTSLGHTKSGTLHASEIHIVQKSILSPCFRNPTSGHASETHSVAMPQKPSEIQPVAMSQKPTEWPSLRNPSSGHASETYSLTHPSCGSGISSETKSVAMF